MRTSTFGIALLTFLSVSLSAGCRTPKGENVQEKRSYALQMQRETLDDLYQKRPEAKAHVQKAPGYAVFSSVGSKILMVATGSGFGVATDNRTGKNTFMRMIEGGGGAGMGIKSYRAVYVFNGREAFEAFRNGSWQVAGDADAGAAWKGEGVAAGAALTSDEMLKPVTVYQFTESGVSLSAVATGVRYYLDDELN